MSKPDRGQRIPELEKLLGKVMPSKRKRKAKKAKKVQDYCGKQPPDDECTCSVCNYAIDNGFSVTIKKKEVKR